eukprot:15468660-Alexandrium_andersonii.AAC.1
MLRPLAGPLADAAWCGLRLRWQAARRHLNAAADALATEALGMARRLWASGRLQPSWQVTWLRGGRRNSE